MKYNWAIVGSRNRISIYDEKPIVHPAYEVLVKDVELTIENNGVANLKGVEIVFHCHMFDTLVRYLDYVPSQKEIKKKTVGRFSKKEEEYVQEGWVEDSKMIKYEAKFQGYAIRFYNSAGGICIQ